MGLSSDQQKRCDEIVEHALSLDAGQRQTFIAESCGDNEELRAEVDAMLAIEPDATAVFDMSPATCMMSPHFGRYRAEELIGSGGMSMVYRALDPVISRRVAIKVLHQRMDSATEEYGRFLSELHLLGSLGHPNIVQVFDAGEHEGLPFIVMEYLDGENLADAIAKDHCADFSLKLSIATQVARALERVHEARVCHRDVKPANVFLERGGRVKLMDFGVSARLNAPRLTETGALIGTLPYLAPEQVRGEIASPTVDIYAFGVLLFELFTGSKPYSGSPAELLFKIVHEPLPLAPLGSLPSSLADLIRSATAKDPSARPRDFAQVRQVLDRIASGEPAQPSPNNTHKWKLAVMAMLVPLVAAGVLWVSVSRRSNQTAAVSPNPPVPAPPTKTVHPETEGPPPVREAPAKPPDPVKSKTTETPAQREDLSREAPTSERQAAFRPPSRPRSTSIQIVEPPPPDTLPGQNPISAVIPPSVTAPGLPAAVPPAVSSAAPAQPKSSEAEVIRLVIARLAAAYRAMNTGEIKRIYPGIDAKGLERAFAASKIQDYRLDPLRDPEIEGDRAKVPCKRDVSQVQVDRTALQREIDGQRRMTSQEVVVHLMRAEGTWKIIMIQ